MSPKMSRCVIPSSTSGWAAGEEVQTAIISTPGGSGGA